MCPVISYQGSVFLPVEFAARLQELHDRELAALSSGHADAMAALIREVRRLRVENQHLRVYAGEPGGETARVI